MPTPPNDTDCISSVYSALWSSGEGEKFSAVRIPHTIMYRMNCPHDWYLSSASGGQLLRRRAEKIRDKEIIRVFTQGKAAGEVVAQFSTEAGGLRKSSTEYFDRDQFVVWVHARHAGKREAKF